MKLLGRPPRPRCALCRRKVDRVEVARDPETGALTVTAHCHGARQIATLTEDMLIGAVSVLVGPAFAEPRR